MKTIKFATRTLASGSTTRTRRGVAALVLGAMCFAACSADETTSLGSDTTPVASDVSEAVDSGPTEPPSTTTVAPATTPPVTAAPPAADAPPANPPAPNPPGTDPPTPDAADPVFNSFSASNVSVCAAPDVSIPTIARMVTLEWDITGADSVYVAIDNVDGPYETNLAATGSLELPVACPGEHIFYVVADNAVGRTMMEVTR